MTGAADIIVILGPTGSGKSTLAMALAQRIGAEILSVDSMQVYRGMDIGTAKPSSDERSRVRHHLIDAVDANEEFTVARFVKLADEVIRDAAERGTRLIATGGTPLYYKALFEGMFEGPAADSSIRLRLRERSNEELHKRLSEIDDKAASRIHVNDTKRLVRALEVYELAGRSITSLQTEWGSDAQRHRAVWLGLNWDRELLNRRINARVKQMIADGWVEETRRLVDRLGELSKTAAEATGYQEIIEHIQGKLTLDDAVERIKIATRQLARRQMKWFRRFPNVTWVRGDQSLEDQLAAAKMT
jgi:tRNA dimethylallyltransferase